MMKIRTLPLAVFQIGFHPPMLNAEPDSESYPVFFSKRISEKYPGIIF
jgi:hypothetical protein